MDKETEEPWAWKPAFWHPKDWSLNLSSTAHSLSPWLLANLTTLPVLHVQRWEAQIDHISEDPCDAYIKSFKQSTGSNARHREALRKLSYVRQWSTRARLENLMKSVYPRPRKYTWPPGAIPGFWKCPWIQAKKFQFPPRCPTGIWKFGSGIPETSQGSKSAFGSHQHTFFLIIVCWGDNC